MTEIQRSEVGRYRECHGKVTIVLHFGIELAPCLPMKSWWVTFHLCVFTSIHFLFVFENTTFLRINRGLGVEFKHFFHYILGDIWTAHI